MRRLRSIGRPIVLGVLLALLALPSLAGAQGLGWGIGTTSGFLDPTASLFRIPAWAQVQTDPKKPAIVSGKKSKVSHVPELDPSAARSAAALVIGGTLVTIGRRRRSGLA